MTDASTTLPLPSQSAAHSGGTGRGAVTCLRSDDSDKGASGVAKPGCEEGGAEASGAGGAGVVGVAGTERSVAGREGDWGGDTVGLDAGLGEALAAS